MLLSYKFVYVHQNTHSYTHTQVFKSTADVSSGEGLYNKYSTVSNDDGDWLALRKIVLARKFPRRMLVQPLTVLEG